MKLPSSKKVIIPEAKLTEYLLSETHAVGKFKAQFFRSFGFDTTNVKMLIKRLYEIAQSDVNEKISSPYGTKYLIEGKIKTPSGKNVKLCTVWISEKDQKQPRFVTAYPV